MARCCGGSGTCTCKIQGGSGVTIAGSGTTGDPYVVTSTGGGGTGTTDPEVVRDTIGAALVAGSGVTITVNDAANTITIASTATGGGNNYTVVQTVNNVIPPRPAGGSAIYVTWIAWDDPSANALASNDTWAEVPAP